MKKKIVSLYLEKENFVKLKKLVGLQEETMSRWLSQRVVKIVELELQKHALKNDK